MIKRREEMTVTVRENMRGGSGAAESLANRTRSIRIRKGIR